MGCSPEYIQNAQDKAAEEMMEAVEAREELEQDKRDAQKTTGRDNR